MTILITRVLSLSRRRPKRTSGSGNTSGSSRVEEIRIGYYMFGEPIPYMITWQQSTITLGQFKQQIKRGNFRYTWLLRHSVFCIGENQDTVKSLIFAGHLISCISCVGQSMSLRSQWNSYSLVLLHVISNPHIQVSTNMLINHGI